MDHQVFPLASQIALRQAALDTEESRIEAINRQMDYMASIGQIRPRSADNGWVPPTQRGEA